jgi:hypothetical protein
MRQVILVTLVLGLIASVVATGASADGHRVSCPNGTFEHPVPQTVAELRQLPRIAAGLNAVPAPYTVQELVDLGNFIDANGDGTFCLKEVSNLRGSSFKIWGFFYGARDNDTSAS